MAVISTPLRYPGGKSSLSSFFLDLLGRNSLYGCTYIEPFAGGAGAGINLLLSKVVSRLVINDIDPAIYAFWRALLDHTDDFIDKIEATEISLVEWHKQKKILKQAQRSAVLDLGFATFFLNRCNRSGILSANPIGGIKQTGKWSIDARFNKKDLIRRICSIAMHKDRIRVSCLDAIELLSQVREESEKKIVYLDPPYYSFGEGLYHNAYADEDHARLANFMCAATFPWIMTYDDHEFIRKAYSRCKLGNFSLNYFAQKPRKGNELLISPHFLKLPDTTVSPQYGKNAFRSAARLIPATA